MTKQNAMCRAAIAFALVLALSPISLLALDPGKSIFQYGCQNWTRQNGLPADRIAAITQTKDGYIWLGTQNGLVRFDGLDFKEVPIDLPQAGGQEVQCLAKSKTGGLWFAVAHGGFGYYDGDKFSTINDERWLRPDLDAGAILEARDGAVWTGANLVLGRWVNGKPAETFFNETNIGTVISLCEDGSGRIWMGTAERGLYRWSDGKLIPAHDDTLKSHYVFAVAADPAGQIWAGTEFGLRSYDSQGQPRQIPPLNTDIKALLVDRHGILWVGTGGNGLARYQNGKFTFLTKADGLGSDYIVSLYEDTEGSLWVGTRDGLSQITDVKFPILSDKDGIIGGSIRSVSASPKGGLWLAGYGVCRFDGKTATTYNDVALLPNWYLKIVFAATNDDVYLVNAEKEIVVLSKGKISARYPNQSWPLAFAEDAESVLTAVGGELFRIENGKLQPYPFKGGKPPEFYWIRNLCVARDGALWVASQNGVFRIQDGGYRQWTTQDGLSGNIVHYLLEDEDGTMWAGLSTGLARIKNGKPTNIRSQQGLHDDRIYAIVPDNHGNFWINSGHGLFRVTRQSLNDCADGKSTRVDCETFEGLESVKFADRFDQENSGCKTLDGRIWFPNPHGVVLIDPEHLSTNCVAPPVHIQLIGAADRESAGQHTTLLRTGDRNLEFSFTALSYISPKKVRVRYQLQGFDPDWIEAGQHRSVRYNNLKPGEYKFQVQACNADGVWNTTGDEISLILPPTFFQTGWFDALCALAGLLLLIAAYRWKVRHMEIREAKLQAQNDLLETNVSRRTEELAQANSALRAEIGEREKLHRQLLETSRQAGMAEVATGVLHNVGNVLNSVNVSASLLTDRLKQSKIINVERVAGLLHEHADHLGQYLTEDPKGKKLPAFIGDLARHLTREQASALEELDDLRKNIEHIKDIVSMQQSYAKVVGVTQSLAVRDLVEDALRMNESSLIRHDIQLVREYDAHMPDIIVDKHKVMQILINLIRNAKYACDESRAPEKRLVVRVASEAGRLTISVTDNGIGIPPENLNRIFNHGFTTRKDGHGFGLHSGALAAKEMGGSLTAQSEGSGRGATFTLELPLEHKTR